MTLRPSVARRAQREIDEVTGGPNIRMPTLADRKKMPYIECILREVFRYVTQLCGANSMLITLCKMEPRHPVGLVCNHFLPC